MKLVDRLPLLCGLFGVTALAENACQYQAKLSSCSTATEFCSSLLGYTGSSNPTYTIYTTIKVKTTVTSTKTDGRKTVFLTSTINLSTTTSTTTSTMSVDTATVYSPSVPQGTPTCYVSTISMANRGGSAVFVPAIAAVQTSCGFAASKSVAASTACSCYIDPVTTVTLQTARTITIKGTPTVILTHYNTYTSTSTYTSTTGSTTSTVTLASCATPTSSCNNTGLQWSYYTALGGNGYPGNSADFDPTLYTTAIPVINGTTKLISITYTSDGSGTGLFYGKGPEPESSFFVDHHGYLYPPQTGVYVFKYTYVDDAAFVWLGPTAFSGWNNTNYDIYATWSSAKLPTVTMFLTKNEYVPIRVAFGQGGGAGGFGLDIYAPDGEVVMQSSTALIGSPYFVSFSCDGTSAPAY